MDSGAPTLSGNYVLTDADLQASLEAFPPRKLKYYVVLAVSALFLVRALVATFVEHVPAGVWLSVVLLVGIWGVTYSLLGLEKF